MTAAASSRTTSAGTRAMWRKPVASHIQPREWRDRAACRSVDPEVFFPAPVAGPALRTCVAAAKEVCAGCPVREACLSWALSALADGIAGGMTEDERRAERAHRARARRRAATTTASAAATNAGGTSADEGEGASAATVAPSRFSHDIGLAGHTSSGRTPRVDDDPGA